MELRVEFLEKALLLLEDKMDIEKEVVKVMAKRDADVIRMKEKIKVLEAELEKKNLTMNCCEVKKYPPALMVCAYQDQWREANSTISFDNITAEYTGRREDMMRTNSDSEVGQLEVESGTFRSPVRGFYRVTFSGGADLHPGKVKTTTHHHHLQVSQVYLHHNGDPVEESRWLTYSDSENTGITFEHGSRTVVCVITILSCVECL